MSAAVWPPISHELLVQREEETLKAELKWLLELLQENLGSLKSALQECVALLAPVEPGTTLAVSSLRSESVKGFVTRIGTRIVKGDIQLRLLTLPPLPPSPSYPLRLTNPVPLPQLSHLATLLNTTLDIIDVAAWTGDPQNPSFISAQLKLLSDTILEAQSLLKGTLNSTDDEGTDDSPAAIPGTQWNDSTLLDPAAFQPPLPPTLAPHLSICDSALTLVVRTLGPADPSATTIGKQPAATASAASTLAGSFSGLGLRARLGLGPKLPSHDEEGRVFEYREAEVIVREKVRVESQDPGLLAIGAKLGAVGREVEGWRGRVTGVWGGEGGGQA